MSQQNALLTVISIPLATNGVIQTVKISLHQFGSCLDQVKIYVATVHVSCLLPYSSYLMNSLSFSRMVARQTTEHNGAPTFMPVTFIIFQWKTQPHTHTHTHTHI